MKAKTSNYWKKRADAKFSYLLRLKNADDDGICTCYTCGKRDHWMKMQCGHYIPRHYLATRFEFLNCKIQCVHCNVFLRGNYTEFAVRLVGEYGIEILADLVERKNWPKKYKIYDYQEMIDKWTDEAISHEMRIS